MSWAGNSASTVYKGASTLPPPEPSSHIASHGAKGLERLNQATEVGSPLLPLLPFPTAYEGCGYGGPDCWRRKSKHSAWTSAPE